MRSLAGEARRGSATVFTAVTVVGLGAMSLGLLAMNLSVEKEQRARQRELASFYAAEAGLSAGFQSMLNGGDGNVASPNAPEPFGSAAFFVVAEDQGEHQSSLVAEGQADGSKSRAELVVRRVPNGQFLHAAFGDEGVLFGAGSFVDSYDSEDGDYALQVGAFGYARQHGSVASNLDVTLEGDTKVYGDVSPGVSGTLDDDAPITAVSGSTQPLLQALDMPPITVPFIPAVSVLSGPVISAGQYHYPSIVVASGDTLVVEGPALIVVDHLELAAGASLVLDATNGAVEVYGTGTFELQAGSSVATYADSASDVAVMLTGDNYGADADGSTLDLGSTATFTGSLYAPNAKLSVASGFEVYGAVAADVLELAPGARLHYDEALGYAGPGASLAFETLLWRPMGEK
jgi:hypothetical protein